MSVNDSIREYINDFKRQLIGNFSSNDQLKQFIESYPDLELLNDELSIRKKRIKNSIPLHEKCLAKRANGEQCSRRKRPGEKLCGTHIKGCPHGLMEELKNVKNNIKKHEIEIYLEDFNGIMYWINNKNDIYDTDDINSNIENPRVIAKYEKAIDNLGNEIFKIVGEIH